MLYDDNMAWGYDLLPDDISHYLNQTHLLRENNFTASTQIIILHNENVYFENNYQIS